MYLRCPFCDCENRLHSGAGCAKCSCDKSPRDIMEKRILQLEEDKSLMSALLAETVIKVKNIEAATQAYGIIA